MLQIRGRDALAAVAIVVVSGMLAASPLLDGVRGLSIDVLTALHWHTLGNRYEPASSPSVVIALDEETLRAPPFKGTPVIAWTREIGRVLTAVIEGGALAVGFDIIFPISIEESAMPFGDDTFGARMRGFDRDFLRALAGAAQTSKLVLGETQLGEQPVLPAAGQRIAVGQMRNIRALNVYSDHDDVVRRVPLSFLTDDRRVPSMSVELAARALGAAPQWADGAMILAGHRVGGMVPNTLTLNFQGGSDIPTYSLADLRACIERGDKEFFRRNFGGKVVLIGSALDLADRKLTSKRFTTDAEVANWHRCAAPAPVPGGFARRSIDGVYVHATAVNNLLHHDALADMGPLGSGLIAMAFAAITASAALLLMPLHAVLGALGLAFICTAGAVAAFHAGIALPLVEPFFAGLLALGLMIGFRLIVADKDKRFLRRSFAFYLAPAVVEKMLASNKPPALGGETRSITIFFSDLAGFSSFSEVMRPTAVVGLMTEYLSAMTEIIEEHGGFVAQYVGDAIMGVFGAPMEDPHHASNAVRAALRCCARLAELNRDDPHFKQHALAHRIGLNTGEVLVGNIGSRRRFNYTVIGDAVNLASRLEGANKYFGTTILASETTMALAKTMFTWREIDAIRVKGRVQPVGIYEPLAEAGHETAEQRDRAALYCKGLSHWRARDFAGAAQAFAWAADVDPPSAHLMQRAQKLALCPPGENWEPINTLEGK